MEEIPKGSDYLDEIFVAVRAFSRELAASREWLARAERTESRAYRLAFLQAARVAWAAAPGHLDAAAARLAALGPPDSLPAPLDRVHANLATMRAELDELGEKIAAALTELATAAIGSA